MKLFKNFSIKLTVFILISLILFIPERAAAQNQVEIFPSNSRLSFRGKLASGNVAYTSLALIETVANEAQGIYSVSSQQLINGDSVLIGNIIYKVATSSALLKNNEIPLDGLLATANIAAGTPVYHRASGPIKIKATVTNLQQNDILTINFPAATASAAIANDGLPDIDGFDFNTNASITCPAGYTATSAPVGTGGTTNPNHLFSCQYTEATASANQQLEFVVTGLINPTAKIGDTVGDFNSMLISLKQERAGVNVFTETTAVGFANAVKMVVRVAPQLSFKIEGVGNSVAACGASTSASTTGSLVPFGSISNLQFSQAAQKLTVTTNAANGYVVTAIGSDQMSLDGDGCPGNGLGNDICIPNFGTPGTATAWTAPATTGNFGFSMEVVDGDKYLNGNIPNVTPNFTYNGVNAAGGASGWSSFADKADGETTLQIINNLRSTNGDIVNLCYKINSSNTNIPGKYNTSVTYTVTASF